MKVLRNADFIINNGEGHGAQDMGQKAVEKNLSTCNIQYATCNIIKAKMIYLII